MLINSENIYIKIKVFTILNKKTDINMFNFYLTVVNSCSLNFLLNFKVQSDVFNKTVQITVLIYLSKLLLKNIRNINVIVLVNICLHSYKNKV